MYLLTLNQTIIIQTVWITCLSLGSCKGFGRPSKCFRELRPSLDVSVPFLWCLLSLQQCLFSRLRHLRDGEHVARNDYCNWFCASCFSFSFFTCSSEPHHLRAKQRVLRQPYHSLGRSAFRMHLISSRLPLHPSSLTCSWCVSINRLVRFYFTSFLNVVLSYVGYLDSTQKQLSLRGISCSSVLYFDLSLVVRDMVTVLAMHMVDRIGYPCRTVAFPILPHAVWSRICIDAWSRMRYKWSVGQRFWQAGLFIGTPVNGMRTGSIDRPQYA